MQLIKQNKAFDGFQNLYEHNSQTLNCPMQFSVFIPKIINDKAKMPVLIYLSGLTCTWENASVKAGAQKYAAEESMILIFPDTSPRGDNVADIQDNYRLGKGASFYLNATTQPWQAHYQMQSYIIQELIELIQQIPQVDNNRIGVTGHSMGGHGALTLAIKNPTIFKSVSALAPVVNPCNTYSGKLALTTYLGPDTNNWQNYDSTCLILSKGWQSDILIDQGLADEFYHNGLEPEVFAQACQKVGVHLELKLHEGYDHSYFFVASFIEKHIQWHSKRLRKYST